MIYKSVHIHSYDCGALGPGPTKAVSIFARLADVKRCNTYMSSAQEGPEGLAVALNLLLKLIAERAAAERLAGGVEVSALDRVDSGVEAGLKALLLGGRGVGPAVRGRASTTRERLEG